MDDRFASWRRRYPTTRVDGRTIGWDDATWQRVRERAARLELDVCRAARIQPSEVRRLDWTGEALRRARLAA
jgi:hypothetical protein